MKPGMKPPSISTRAARGRKQLTRVVILAAALVALAIPASASAITVSGTAAPTDPAAGANSNFVIDMDFSGGQVRDLTVGLPPGMIGDPTATPKCTVAQLNANACPANTQVGEVAATANILMLPLPIDVTGTLYNLVAQPGEPARFGIVLTPPVGSPIILQSAVQLRETDFGLNTVIVDIPNTTLLPGDTTIVSQTITLFGTPPGASKPFMRNPTSCASATTNFTAVPYSGATGNGSASFTPTNCGALPFSPTFSARVGAPGQNAPLGKPPISSVIEQDTGEAGLQKAEVFIPPEFGVDLGQLNEFCPIDQFNAAACPPNSVVGSAFATSPLLTEPLTGPVTLVQAAVLPDIGLNLAGPLSLNLHGTLDIAGSVTFSGLPDIPISHFELNFIGGPDGLNITQRDLCLNPPLFHENFTGHNGAMTSLDTLATVEGGCAPANKCKAKAKKKKKGKKSDASAAKKKKKKNPCKKKKKKRKKK
jgi:hypothetical protein